MQRDELKKEENIVDTRSSRIAIILAEFNSDITDKLLEGAQRALGDAEVKEENIKVFRVPGSVEIPTVASAIAHADTFDAIVCLGAVIRGETSHYDYVCRIAADGIKEVGMKYRMPVMFGILTCDTLEQAQARCKPDTTNSGYQAARGAISMIQTLDEAHQV